MFIFIYAHISLRDRCCSSYSKQISSCAWNEYEFLCSVKVFKYQVVSQVITRNVFMFSHPFAKRNLIAPVAFLHVLQVIKNLIAKGAHCELFAILEKTIFSKMFLFYHLKGMCKFEAHFCGWKLKLKRS